MQGKPPTTSSTCTAPARRTDLATTCRDVNRDLVLGAWAALTPAERAAARATPQRIMLDADDVRLTGSRWITPHQFAWTGEDGRPHLQARRLRADWTDWRWRFMPAIFRGTFYCQLASPEYLRRLFLGEVVPPPRAAADSTCADDTTAVDTHAHPGGAAPPHERNRALLAVALVNFAGMAGFGTLFPILPQYGLSIGANATQIGLALAAFSVGQLLAGARVGRLSDRYGRRPVLLWSLALTDGVQRRCILHLPTHR